MQGLLYGQAEVRAQGQHAGVGGSIHTDAAKKAQWNQQRRARVRGEDRYVRKTTVEGKRGKFDEQFKTGTFEEAHARGGNRRNKSKAGHTAIKARQTASKRRRISQKTRDPSFPPDGAPMPHKAPKASFSGDVLPMPHKADCGSSGPGSLAPSLPGNPSMAERFRQKLCGGVLEWSRSLDADTLADGDALADAHIVSAGALRFFANMRGDFARLVELWGERPGCVVACVLAWTARDSLADLDDQSDDGKVVMRTAGFLFERRSAARKRQSSQALCAHIRQHFHQTDEGLRTVDCQFCMVWGNMSKA